MRRGRQRWFILAAVFVLLAGIPLVLLVRQRESDVLPIFDAHMHFSTDALAQYSPEQVLAYMREGRLSGALVSSSGNTGTYELNALADDLVIAGLRPYRDRGETASWMRDDTIIAYLREQLAQHSFATIGEFHVSGADADLPVVRAVIDLAREHALILHAHSDADAIDRIFAYDPKATVLWAHAGFASPDVVRRMLDRYPNLSADLAFRTDYYDGTKVAPEWRKLFMSHPDRFMLGSDSYTPGRIPHIAAHAEIARGWLNDLPKDVAKRLAHQNAEKLLTQKSKEKS